MFLDALGPTPRSLPIVFLSDNVNECCYERYELRDGTKLLADGDGETFRVWSKEKEDYVEMTTALHPGLMEGLARKANKEWNTVLTLRFLILPIKSVMGVWSFTTKGEASSIPAIIAAFDSVKQWAKTVVGVPFDLTVEMVKSQKPDSKSKFPVVKLVPNMGVTHLQMIGELKDRGKVLNKMLTAELVEKEVAALPAPKGDE